MNSMHFFNLKQFVLNCVHGDLFDFFRNLHARLGAAHLLVRGVFRRLGVLSEFICIYSFV